MIRATPASYGCFVNAKYRTVTRVSSIELLSRRLKELRNQSGLTQEEFAQIAGFSYKFYQQIESGRKKQVWLETVNRLANAHGLEIWQLLGPGTPTSTIQKTKVPPSKVHYKSRVTE